MSIEKKVLNGLVTSSIVGSTLAGCMPVENTGVQNPENSKEKSSKTQVLSPEEVQELVEVSGEFEVPKKGEVRGLLKELDTEKEDLENITSEDFEKEEFDYSTLEILNWNDFEIGSIEKMEPGYVVEIDTPTSLFVIPLKNDEFLDKEKEVEEIILDKGLVVEISEKRTLVGPQGEEIEVGLLSNTYGAKAVGAVVMEGTDSSGVEIEFTTERESNESAVLYMNRSDSIYPNKVSNTYTALLNISKYQDKNGSLKAGEEYSYLEMIGLADGSKKYDYLVGLMSSGEKAWAGGVCAMATGTSLLVHQDPENRILEQWHHPARYFQGPFSMSPYMVDATVQEVVGGKHYDFRWEMNEDRYLEISAHMSLSDIPYSETASDGIGGLSDVNVLFSMSFTDEYPEGQTERLQRQLDSYTEFRESGHAKVFDSFENFKYSIQDIERAVHLIYNREDLRYFEQEIEQKEYLKDMLAFQEAVNSYVEDPEARLSEYLKTTEWYENYRNNPNRSEENLDLAIRMISYTNIQGQPLQCVTYVGVLPLLYPELDMQRIGGSGVSSAAQLVNDEYAVFTGTAGTGFGGLLVAGKGLSIDNYHAGDIFVTRTGNYGHVGAILAETHDEFGNKLLLVTDSNRKIDGKIRFFVVEESSMDAILGPSYRYIIRSAVNHTKVSLND